ncbi:TPA: hypothetical protein ACNIM8_005944 [Pseudomonas aeruginosa]
MTFTWDRKESLEQYAERMLSYGDQVPFDAPDSWRFEDNGEIPAPPPSDWAERAARAIISEFEDRGATMSEAFNPERVDENTRKEIIVVMATIMRQAANSTNEPSR